MAHISFVGLAALPQAGFETEELGTGRVLPAETAGRDLSPFE
jgi:hypothetical protein